MTHEATSYFERDFTQLASRAPHKTQLHYSKGLLLPMSSAMQGDPRGSFAEVMQKPKSTSLSPSPAQHASADDVALSHEVTQSVDDLVAQVSDANKQVDAALSGEEPKDNVLADMAADEQLIAELESAETATAEPSEQREVDDEHAAAAAQLAPESPEQEEQPTDDNMDDLLEAIAELRGDANTSEQATDEVPALAFGAPEQDDAAEFTAVEASTHAVAEPYPHSQSLAQTEFEDVSAGLDEAINANVNLPHEVDAAQFVATESATDVVSEAAGNDQFATASSDVLAEGESVESQIAAQPQPRADVSNHAVLDAHDDTARADAQAENTVAAAMDDAASEHAALAEQPIVVAEHSDVEVTARTPQTHANAAAPTSIEKLDEALATAADERLAVETPVARESNEQQAQPQAAATDVRAIAMPAGEGKGRPEATTSDEVSNLPAAATVPVVTQQVPATSVQPASVSATTSNVAQSNEVVTRVAAVPAPVAAPVGSAPADSSRAAKLKAGAHRISVAAHGQFGKRIAAMLSSMSVPTARVLAKAHGPLIKKPKSLRDAAGVVALHTFVLGVALWFYAAVWRSPYQASAVETFDFANAGLPQPDNEPGHDDGHGETKHGAKDAGADAGGGHGEAKKDGKPAKPILGDDNKFVVNDEISTRSKAAKDGKKEAKSGGH